MYHFDISSVDESNQLNESHYIKVITIQLFRTALI